MKRYVMYIFLCAMFVYIPACKQSSEASRPLTRQALPIPALLQDENPADGAAQYSLQAQPGSTVFYQNHKTATLGYNGSYLGPVLRMRKGETVSVRVKNALQDATTIHWHGLEVEGPEDGGIHGKIDPGKTWEARFTVDQPAATAWFHPHLMHMTGEQVYKGLAGLVYIEDEESDQLDIPKDYGKNDFPLVVQDKRFSGDGSIPYTQDMSDVTNGFVGNTILVNGAIAPYLEVPKGKVRLRLLNASNARVYTFSLSGNKPFWQIASDGGLLEKPVQLTKLTLSPAERAEIIADFSGYHTGQEVTLRNFDTSILTFRVKEQPDKDYSIPASLVTIPKLDSSQVKKVRHFVFEGAGRSVNINGLQMDMNRIDETVKLGDTEMWEITNPGTEMVMGHPFHAHGVRFQVLTRNGGAPPENERGWKDTVYVNPYETVQVIAKFRKIGVFMYHCHILEHEDNGMMGQYQVKS